MKNKNILLVGGCGFIGHNLALELVKKDYNVSIVDSLAVNNLLSFTDNSIVNKSLYRNISGGHREQGQLSSYPRMLLVLQHLATHRND